MNYDKILFQKEEQLFKFFCILHTVYGACRWGVYFWWINVQAVDVNSLKFFYAQYFSLNNQWLALTRKHSDHLPNCACWMAMAVSLVPRLHPLIATPHPPEQLLVLLGTDRWCQHGNRTSTRLLWNLLHFQLVKAFHCSCCCEPGMIPCRISYTASNVREWEHGR